MNKLFNLLNPMVLKKLIVSRKFRRSYKALLESNVFVSKRLNINEIIDVYFFVIHGSVWKLDEVYRLFEQDPRFNPVIVACPFKVYGDDAMFENMHRTQALFNKKGFNVISSYDEKSETWVDIHQLSNNKIVFFTNPHDVTFEEYSWENFTSEWTFYVPYHHQIDAAQWYSQWQSPFHHSMSRLFYVDQFHKLLAKKLMLNCAGNVKVTGYPGTEAFYTSQSQQTTWKPQDKKKSRVIFAPHHTIEFDANLGVCEFLNVAQTMRELAIKYRDSIQFAFKPHPILRNKLDLHPDWGKEKTNEYYDFWENSANTQLADGEYIDLFLDSDAMVHDSGSFLAEYLYVNKPTLYLCNETTTMRFNEYGLECLSCCSQGGQNSIESFLEAVLQGEDEKAIQRQMLVSKRLIPQTLPSKSIYQEVCNQLGLL
ncbi:CDP-glycerol glycerophosphotransferase family protein [Vibrio alfacsensis]|uniref:CDP-glycerol glycerophosphotransferase family protein n=1 Tax=Vibrio alfacsensis TaxID=1074311 RepID=UPI002ADD96F0|nr:CDP-glycerol glycerophosphotransferase family protein [Vibrio alfacsensis]WQE76409.1 CDP-glycerol glycerophosphotransferase family protein [Vibrio alfacsensis]